VLCLLWGAVWILKYYLDEVWLQRVKSKFCDISESSVISSNVIKMARKYFFRTLESYLDPEYQIMLCKKERFGWMFTERGTHDRPHGRSPNPLTEIRIILSRWQHNRTNPEIHFDMTLNRYLNWGGGAHTHTHSYISCQCNGYMSTPLNGKSRLHKTHSISIAVPRRTPVLHANSNPIQCTSDFAMVCAVLFRGIAIRLIPHQGTLRIQTIRITLNPKGKRFPLHYT
jgi:hypothetical protein